MTKEINLTVGERILIVAMFNEIGKATDIQTLGLLLDETKNLAMSKEQWDAIPDLVKTPDGQGGEAYVWDDEKTEKPFTLQDKTVDLLKAVIKKKDEAKEFSVADKAVVTLSAKL